MNKKAELTIRQEEMRLRVREQDPVMRLAKLVTFQDWLRQMQSQGSCLECRCTRPLEIGKPHCPNCASRNCYALQKMEGLLATGEVVAAMQYRCRKCGLYFTDLQAFLHCEALAPQPSMKEIRKTEKAQTALQKAGFSSKDDFIERLKEFRASQDSKKNGDDK